MAKTSLLDLRKQLEEDETKGGLTVKARCNACQFLLGKCPQKEAPCIKLGKTGASKSCKFFEPNYVEVRKSEPEVIMEIGKMVRHFPEHILHLIGYAIMNSANMSRVTENVLGVAIRLGQPVMLNLSAPRMDYLNCWFSAYAMGMTKDKRALICATRLVKGGQWSTSRVLMDPESIMTFGQFKTHRKYLTKQKLINAPDKVVQNLMPFIPFKLVDEYVPPPMTVLTQATEKAKAKAATHTFKVEKNKDGSRVVTI